MRPSDPNGGWVGLPPVPGQAPIPPPPAPKSQNTNLKWLLLLVPVLLCCVCTGGASVWGMGLYTDEVCDHLKKAERITDVTGPISKCKINYGPTMELTDFDTFVFDLSGPTGSGIAYVQSSSGPDGNEVFEGILFVPKGGDEILVEGKRPPTK
ncbi:MAG: hypothetical protein JNM17_06660 [Archangium sp.]|nr:hypothetical protein [Archangium sp.]